MCQQHGASGPPCNRASHLAVGQKCPWELIFPACTFFHHGQVRLTGTREGQPRRDAAALDGNACVKIGSTPQGPGARPGNLSLAGLVT